MNIAIDLYGKKSIITGLNCQEVKERNKFSLTWPFSSLNIYLKKIDYRIFDDFVKSLKKLFLVIPVKTGIQYYQVVKSSLDSRFRGSDDFLRRQDFLKTRKRR